MNALDEPRARRAGIALLFALGASAALAFGPRSVAQVQEAASALTAVFACRSEPDATRLACFDRAVGRLWEQQNAGQVAVIDSQKVREVRRQAFGFALPSLNAFNRVAGGEEIDRAEFVVERASRDGSGMWVMVMQGGQVWRQTGAAIYLRPKAGSKVEIAKGTLGSFTISVDGGRTFKAERVR